ncbi:hypothetical protein ACKWTF_016621 [Chironomus riparius]
MSDLYDIFMKILENGYYKIKSFYLEDSYVIHIQSQHFLSNSGLQTGKTSHRRPKNSWKEAVDRDSGAFGMNNWQTVASDRVSFRRHLIKAMDHNRSVRPEKSIVYELSIKFFNSKLIPKHEALP